MTELVIKQSGKRGSGMLIVIAVLAILGFAKYGPRLGRLQDAEERRADEQTRIQQLLQRTDIDLDRARKALEESHAAERLLESLSQPAPESPPIDPANVPSPTAQPAAANLPPPE